MNLAYTFATGGGEQAGGPRLPGSLQVNRRLSQWLRFGTDGVVTIRPGKVEIGQGILTALTQIAAEELDVALKRITVEPAATPDSPNEGVTSGSLSVQESGTALRHACAEARAIHLQVAAQRSGVPLDSLRVEDGSFMGPAGAIGSYWSQAKSGLLETDATGTVPPKPPAAHRIVGQPIPRRDLPDKVFGAPRFMQDLQLPRMLHARILRPPARGATLTELRDGPLPNGAGIVRDGSFLAVVAETEHDANAGVARLAGRASWDVVETLPEQATLPDWLDQARAEASEVAAGGEAAPTTAHSIRARFFRPYIAHASIGPSCAVALWQGETVEIWCHSQGVYNLRADLSTALRIPLEQVVVRHVEGSGCYGHNGADDVALDAALAARAHPGRPVRVVWSRAEELAWSPHSPAMLTTIEAGIDAEGRIALWRSEVVSNGHSSRPGRGKEPTLLAAAHLETPFPVLPSINPPVAAGGGAHRNLVPIYRLPNHDIRMRRLLEMPLRTSALRGLGALINVWAIESVMDELAALANADPVAFRLQHLEDERAVDVLRAAASMAGWPRTAVVEGRGLGIAVARYKNSGAWCAVAAEIEAAEVVRARHLWVAVDVGQVINPDGVANQLEGGTIQAASIALKEAVQFDRRTVTSDAWEHYPILRFSEVPDVTVQILNRPEQPPLGAGEASMGPTVAALANAIHGALGVRLRAMPFTPENIAAAADAT